MSVSERGALITLEGLEGVGKSTSVKTIELLLAERGLPCITTREPGGTHLGEQLRQLLLNSSMCSMTELLLMFAARTEHVQTVIEPALAAGQWVICDRFTDSSYAYQGGGRGIELETISQLEKLTLGSIVPDCTFILDLPAGVGLKRAARRKQNAQSLAGESGEKTSIEPAETVDRFENEKLLFFEQVREVFLSRAGLETRNHVVDGSGTVTQVQQRIRVELEHFINDFLNLNH